MILRRHTGSTVSSPIEFGQTTSALSSPIEFRRRIGTLTSPTEFEKAIEYPPKTAVTKRTTATKYSWRTLPCKDQLAILALGRFADFFQMAALQSYTYYQLKSFNPTLSESTLSWQSGVLQGSFTFTQIVTSIMWGWLADRPFCGRKLALLIGLAGTGFSCVGLGFSTSFSEAIFWRSLGGTVNGTVGVSRTMLAENIKDKRHLPRAFLLLPISFNFASFFGPTVGGWLADIHTRVPATYGLQTSFRWTSQYPYALPSLCSAAILFVVAAIAMCWLRETLPNCDCSMPIKILVSRVRQIIFRDNRAAYSVLDSDKDEPLLQSWSEENLDEDWRAEKRVRISTQLSKSRPSRIWTSNVAWVFLAIGLFDFHMGAFNGLWPVLLSSPHSNSEENKSVLFFTDGLAMTPAEVGRALGILGILGFTLQLSLYPSVEWRLGTLRCFRIFSFLFPVAYFAAPYIALVPETAPVLVWTSITLVLFLQVLARTFSLPATIVLINNCAPDPSALGFIHGAGQAVSAGARSLGPVVGGYLNEAGMNAGTIAFPWWATAFVALLGWQASMYAQDGSAQ